MVRHHHNLFSGAKIGKSILSKTTTTSSSTTASHSSISSIHQHPTNNPVAHFPSLTKMVSSSGAQDPLSATTLAHHQHHQQNNNSTSSMVKKRLNASATLANSRFFKQQKIAKENVDAAVRQIQNIAASNVSPQQSGARGTHHHHTQQQQTPVAPPQWWYFHGPQYGWLNYPPQRHYQSQQQQASSTSSQQQQARNHTSNNPHQTITLGSFIMRLMFPWFVFFLVIGEIADYFIGELAIGTANATVSGGGGGFGASVSKRIVSSSSSSSQHDAKK